MFDLFLLSESKLNSTFPNNLFKIKGFKIFRCDRNRFGKGLILHVNEQVPCKFTLGIYMFKVDNSNTRTRCEICSKLTIKTLKRRHWHHYGVFNDNFEHISHLVLVFLLLTLSR